MYRLYIKKNTTSKQMLDYCLKDYANINDYTLSYNSYGKPYIEDSSIFFNISHSKDIHVLAIGDAPLGVDIQHLTFKENIHHTFNDKEKDILNNADDKKCEFTKMWTIKEAYVKMLGVGLSYGLNNVDTTITNAHIIIGDDYVISIIQEEKKEK